MLVEFQINNLRIREPEKGVLVFGGGGAAVFPKLGAMYGDQLHYWCREKPVHFDSWAGHTLVIPSILTRLEQVEMVGIIQSCRNSEINLIATIPSVDNIIPFLTEAEIEQQLSFLLANFHLAIFTRCNQNLAGYLGSILNHESSRFTNIALYCFTVDIPDSSSILVS